MNIFNTTSLFILEHVKASGYVAGDIIETEGFAVLGDKGAARWKATGNIIAASQQPITLNDIKMSDLSGNEFELVGEGVIDLNSLGGITAPFQAIATTAGLTTVQSLGGGGGVTVEDEGVALPTVASTLDFVGAGVVASGAGTTKTITIAGGSGGGEVHGLGFWNFELQVAGFPAVGGMNFDNVDINLATQVWFNETNADGLLSPAFYFSDFFVTGGVLHIQDQVDSGNYITLEFNSNGVDFGASRRYDIINVTAVGVTPSAASAMALIVAAKPDAATIGGFPPWSSGNNYDVAVTTSSNNTNLGRNVFFWESDGATAGAGNIQVSGGGTFVFRDAAGNVNMQISATSGLITLSGDVTVPSGSEIFLTGASGTSIEGDFAGKSFIINTDSVARATITDLVTEFNQLLQVNADINVRDLGVPTFQVNAVSGWIQPAVDRGGERLGKITLSTLAPSGGEDGDLWLRYV